MLKDYILSYEQNGEIVASLFNYYDKYIKGLDQHFSQYSYFQNKLVLCFFKDHADVNPSMGYIKHRRLKGVMCCHCFGCGKTADVVRLHQILRSQWEGVELSEKDACLEIAEMFNIPIEDGVEDEDFESAYNRNLRKAVSFSKSYTIRDFSAALMRERQSEKVNLNNVNRECVKMIATQKQLYN